MNKFVINWNVIPTYEIGVADLIQAYNICDIMKARKTRAYCYSITNKATMDKPLILIKYGMSYDNSPNFGERIYRQIAHSKSWGEQRSKGHSGADWRVIEEDFLEHYGFEIKKDNLIIKIWDLTNYPFTLCNQWDEVNKIESHLINEYVQIYGKKPIGNINDESRTFFRSAVAIETMNNLFIRK
jgi:hypothetical protein